MNNQYVSEENELIYQPFDDPYSLGLPSSITTPPFLTFATLVRSYHQLFGEALTGISREFHPWLPGIFTYMNGLMFMVFM